MNDQQITKPNDAFMRGYHSGYEAGRMAAEDAAENKQYQIERLRRALENLLAILPPKAEDSSTNV